MAGFVFDLQLCSVVDLGLSEASSLSVKEKIVVLDWASWFISVTVHHTLVLQQGKTKSVHTSILQSVHTRYY